MNSKVLQRIFSILLVAGMLLSFVQPQKAQASQVVAPKPPADLSKVEQLVLDQISEKGSTAFFVWMTEQADLSGASNLATKLEKGQFVLKALTETADRTQKGVIEALKQAGLDYKSYYIANKVFVPSGNYDTLVALASRADVAKITANHVYQLPQPYKMPPQVIIPLTVEPNISFIKADQAWAMGVTGQGTVLAGNDTGLDVTVAPIAPHYRGCLNPPTCSSWDYNYNWWDATGGSPNVPYDGYGHGTHTTGTMVGDDGLGNQIGVAPGAQTIHCRNMDAGGGGTDDWFTTCFEWDLAPWDLSGGNADPAMAPDAVNNSWGYWGGGAPQFEDEIANLQAAGTLVEVSAGNEGPGCYSLRSPGDYAEVLTTGSVNHANPYPGTITGFSSRGPSSLYPGDYFPDIMAPGENIRSVLPGGSFDWWSGTSMAGPHATALVGLIWSACPAMKGDVAGTIDLIKQTATPLTGQPGSSCGGDYTTGPNNDWGFGTIDAAAAVAQALAMCTGVGKLDGTVTDSVTSDPIENAVVKADWDGGASWSFKTDVSGYYTKTLPNGLYTVTVSHPQYETASVSGVEVITDVVTTQDFQLVPKGILEGYVTDFDNATPLAGAVVTADDGTTATTDGTGFYQMYLDEGTYDVTASMENYAPETAAVDILSGQTTQQDFALKAAVVFIPSPVHVTLDWQTTDSLPAEILNRQPWDYAFELKEKPGGFIPALQGKGEWLYRNTNGVMMKTNGGGEKLAYPGAYRWEPAYPAAVNVLIYADDYIHTAPNTFLDQALQSLGMAYTAHYDGDWAGFVSDLSSGTWDLVLVGNDNYYEGSWPAAMNTYIQGGGKAIVHTWTFSWDPYNTLWTTLGVTWAMDDYDPPDPVYWWDPSNPIFDGVPEFTNLTSGIYGTYGQYVEPLAGFDALAGYTTPGPDPNQAALVLGNDGRTIFKGFLDGQNSADLDTDGTMDGIELWINMINGVLNGFSSDVPWLGEEPITGTVPASDTLPVTLWFSATYAAGIDQPGDYYATLNVNGDPKVSVPVTMTVLPGEDMGKVEGTVMSLGYCDTNPYPLEEALVTIDTSLGDTYTMTTDVSGHYQLWLSETESPVDITVTFPEHQTGVATGVEIVAGETTTQNFDLRWLYPCEGVTPGELSSVLQWGDNSTQPLTITNSGATDLNFELAEVDRGWKPAKSVVSIPPFTGTLPPDTAPVSIGRAPVTNPSGGSTTPLSFPLAGAPAFAIDVYPGYNLVTFMSDDPSNWTVVAPEPGNQYFAGDFINGDFSKLYVIDYGTQSLYAVDTATGAVTLIGPSTPYSGESWTGMTGSSDGVMYASSTNISRSTLYTVDLSTGTATVVGEITNAPAIIDIAINAAGEMYGVDIVNDVLVAIDPATGAGTVVGSLGVGANYAQGMDFEEESGVLFWAAYTTQGELRIIDPATGASTSVGAFPGGAEVDSLAFATGGGADVPWLSETPITGTVPADTGLVTVDVTMDSAVVNQPGDYFATLKVKSNDPVNATVNVPITMTVVPAEDMGKLTGTILDNCLGSPLEDVLVSIEGGTPITFTYSEADGGFTAWLVEGTYTVTFSMGGYLDFVTSVDIVAGETTTQDVSLIPDRPCINTSTDFMEVWVLTGTAVYTEINGIDMWNNGGQDNPFEITEKDGGYMPFIQGSQPVIFPAAQPPAGTATGNGPAVPERAFTIPAVIPMDGPNVLLLNADDDNSYGSPIQALLLAYGDLGLVDLYDARYGTPSLAELQAYDVVVVWSNYTFADATGIGNVLADYVDAGGKVVDLEFAIDPNWGYQGRFATEDYTAMKGSYTGYNNSCLGTYDPTHPIMEGVTNVCDLYRLVGTYLTPDSTDVAYWQDGELFVAVKDDGSVATINGYVGYYFQYTGQMPDVLHNAILWVVEGTGGDVPWIWEEPVTGTIPSLGDQHVDVMFSALYTDTTPMPLGTYTATLKIKNQDSVAKTQKVTSLMHIVEEYITPVAGFEAVTPACDGDAMIFTNTTVVGVPWATDYTWDFGDGATSNDETPTHVFPGPGTYTVTLEACNLQGYTEFCTTATAPVEVKELVNAAFDVAQNGLTVDFTNLSTGADSFLWAFGDGVTSTEVSPSHVYAASGAFTVTLTAVGFCGVQEATSVLDIMATADLALTKEASASEVPLNAELQFTLMVDNIGPDAATNVVVVDTLPDGVTFVSGTGCTVVGQVVTCTLGDIASGASASVVITVTAPAVPGTVTNSAVASADQYDPNAENNTATVDVLVQNYMNYLPMNFKH